MTRTEPDDKIELGKILRLLHLPLVLEFKIVNSNYFILLFYFWRLRIRDNMTLLSHCHKLVT